MASEQRETLILRVWPWLTRLAVAMAVGNLLMAVVVRLWGPALHPVFVDPHTWLLFLVTGLSLAAQAGLMRYTQHVLMREAANLQARLGARERHRRIVHRKTRLLRHLGRHRRVGAQLSPMVTSGLRDGA
ncbi:hypothetical protein [Nitrogeniibacter aestuarii]|uniref:hypothetical protein n=1 Tax=Nitrogeniibacter aestuarii TaxID=2815343 RepID=UPI001E393BFF|nr:hypothetical protein [Nitrogeniibacter aestuarii]